MDYEQKYKEALERAKIYKNHCTEINDNNGVIGELEYIFPELKESEDEKIREAIISVFTGESSFTPKEEAQKYVAWLEKQGEKKPINPNAIKDLERAILAAHPTFKQKPTWSDEDDKTYYSLLADIRARQDSSTSTLEAYYNEQINWLKSLKERLL